MTTFRAVAWDIDGTLIDSEPLHQRGLIAASADLGVDLDDLDPEAFRGVHARDIWKALEPRFAPGAKFETWITGIESYYVAHAGELEPNPGAIEAMRELAARGVPQACVSNSGRTIVDANIDALGIGKIIAFSLSLDDVKSGKPDPEPFREAAHRLGVKPHEVVAVEDSGAGARSARAAGLYVVGYAPQGDAFVGSDRSVARIMEIMALFDA
jgi:HAD superfamily hydrolase (TIGR01509 family)